MKSLHFVQFSPATSPLSQIHASSNSSSEKSMHARKDGQTKPRYM